MTTAEFSESSYAFAMVRELTEGTHGTVICAPEFPTLRKEGAKGGGYDVKIKYQLAAVFYQFKIPQIIQRPSKLKPPQFPVPYYRIPLRTRTPNQHQLLFDLEAPRSNHRVYYAAPKFHQSQQLNHHYLQNSVVENSAYIRPRNVGVLDEEEHHIAYTQYSKIAWRYSEPVQIEGEISSSAVRGSIEARIAEAPRQTLRVFLRDLGGLTRELINKAGGRPLPLQEDLEPESGVPYEPDQGEEPQIRRIPEEPFVPITTIPKEFQRIAEMVRFRVGCELLVFGRRARP